MAVVAVCAVALVIAGKEAATPQPLTDSTAELQAKFDAVKPGGTLKLTPGVFAHSGVIGERLLLGDDVMNDRPDLRPIILASFTDREGRCHRTLRISHVVHR